MKNLLFITVLKPINSVVFQFFFMLSMVHAANFTFDSGGGINLLSVLSSTSTINVTGTDGLPITDVNVTVDTTSLQVAGTPTTLNLTLREVNSDTTVTLLSESSSLLQNTEVDNLQFDDQAAQSYTVTAPSPFGPGTFQPDPGSLGDFNGGNFNDGDWELTVAYSAGLGDIGIDSWQLNVTTAVIPEPQTYLMFTTILVGTGVMMWHKRKKSSKGDIVENDVNCEG